LGHNRAVSSAQDAPEIPPPMIRKVQLKVFSQPLITMAILERPGDQSQCGRVKRLEEEFLMLVHWLFILSFVHSATPQATWLTEDCDPFSVY
jgi:hypothetical protein